MLVSVRIARAEETLVHVVRPGETLASIAELYYGDARRESVLVAENGLTSEGGSSIQVGLRLSVPTVSYHRVQEGETWAFLATRFYGDATRAFVLIESNAGSTGVQPDPGAELLIPYPVRHVCSQTDSLRKLSAKYYGAQKEQKIIRRFNQLKHSWVNRGQLLLLPIADLVLSDKGRQLAEAAGAKSGGGGEVRTKQTDIDAQLPVLRDHVKRGRYADAVAMANYLMGEGDLTEGQFVTVQRELGTALVALDRDDLAQHAFADMLARQPFAELDTVRTSPKVLRVFQRAQEAAAAQKLEPAVDADGKRTSRARLDAQDTSAARDAGVKDSRTPTSEAARPAPPPAASKSGAASASARATEVNAPDASAKPALATP